MGNIQRTSRRKFLLNVQTNREYLNFIYLVYDILTKSFYMYFQPLKLNNTRKAQKEILFFNRVPKVGSQTTMELMRALALKNNFHYHKDRTQKVETIKLTNNEEVRLLNQYSNNNFIQVFRSNRKTILLNMFLKYITTFSICCFFLLQKWLSHLINYFSTPSVYVKHVCFVDFQR